MYINDDKDLETTPIITFIKANALNNFVTLKTLNVLKILTVLKAPTALPPPPTPV